MAGGDPFRLEQVFRNVLENALAACRDPVAIDVHCTAAQFGDRPAARVAVCDHGPQESSVEIVGDRNATGVRILAHGEALALDDVVKP